MTEFVVPRSIPTARAMSDPLCEQPGSLVGHLVVYDQFEALRTHDGHRREVTAAPWSAYTITAMIAPITAPMSSP